MKDYRQLNVWQRTHSFAGPSDAVTKSFPQEKWFRLTSHTRRAASAIPASLAEEPRRDRDGKLQRFVDIAHGVASELANFLPLASERRFLPTEAHPAPRDETAQIERMLGALARKLKADR